jgi:hypothetical protein
MSTALNLVSPPNLKFLLIPRLLEETTPNSKN